MSTLYSDLQTEKKAATQSVSSESAIEAYTVHTD